MSARTSSADTGAAASRDVLVYLLLFFMLAAPACTFFLLLNRHVSLVALTGVDLLCAECDRQATRTLPGAAASLRERGVYVYDRKKYSKPPAWCDRHGPGETTSHPATAFLGAVIAFAVVMVAYEVASPR